MKIFLLIACCCFSTIKAEMNISINSVSKLLVPIFIDQKTEDALGEFPFDRSKTALVISNLRKAGAKGIVLKYFLDQNKAGNGDDQLAEEIKRIPVILQARFDEDEKTPNLLDDHFNIESQVRGKSENISNYNSGWIPLSKFAKNAYGVGFVDVSESRKLTVPLVVKYKNKLMPSLWLVILELAYAEKAQIILGERAAFSHKKYQLNIQGEVKYKIPPKDFIDSISFVDVLKGKFSHDKIKGKIIIIGVDNNKMPSLETSIGKIGLHRLFYHSIKNLLYKN